MRVRSCHRALARAIAAGSVFVATTAAAQVDLARQSDQPIEAVELTLENAVRRAVENNPDLAIVRLGREVELTRVAESQGAFVPLFSTTLGRTGDVAPPSNSLFGDRGIGANDWFSSTGVRQRLPWGGGTWSASWDASRTTSSNPLSSFDPSLYSRVQVALSQPLIRDREIDQARQQYIIARRNQDTSELRFRESVVQTVAAVKQSYWTLKALLANVTVQQRSLELAEELVRQNKARVDVGQAPPLDLVQAEAEVAQRRENVIRANTAAGDAEDRLRRLIMNPLSTSFWRTRLTPVDEVPAVGSLPDVDAAVNSALDGRLDIARARNDVANAGTDIDFYSNQRLPDVRLEMSYRGNGLGGTQFLRTGGFPGVVTGTSRKSFGNVLDQVFTNEFSTWSFGLTMSYPLGRSYEEASLARAGIERRQAVQRIASLQLEAAEGVRQAARQLHSTAERIEAARAGAKLAEERVDTEQRRFQVGLSTTFLVTQAQRDLVQAQVNLLQATLDHQSSLVNFEALQQAPPLATGERVAVSGTEIVRLPTSSPSGVFRQGGGTGIP
jgi:HAE1 family hydrophobic/amphiphilic exporter-1